MRNKKLIIDKEFRELIRPLRKDEYYQLEANLNADGCREPLTVWDDIIVDGHNRYEICTRLNIPFEVHNVFFESRDEAISWICANQLGRRNISDETRKFLIGKQYEAEKVISINRNPKGKNQYTEDQFSKSTAESCSDDSQLPPAAGTARRIGSEYNISHATVQKYAAFAGALEKVGKKEPAIVSKILSGRFKISHENLVELAARSEKEVKELNRQMEKTQQSFAQYSTGRKEIRKIAESSSFEVSSTPSVKDMPDYDPDAELTGLALTVPSWRHSVSRAVEKTNFENASSKVKSELQSVLHDLLLVINEMLIQIEG